MLIVYSIFLLSPILLLGRVRSNAMLNVPANSYSPWFTGPLLAPSAVNAKPQNPVLAAYGALTFTYGQYDDNWSLESTSNMWSINPFLEGLIGLNEFIGIDVYTSSISNFKKKENATYFQDTIVRVGFQLATDSSANWTPDVRVAFQEVFPTGNYQKLDPKKLGIDATGHGSFQSGLYLISQKLIPIKKHFLLIKGAVGTFFLSPVKVEGINYYGGNERSKGRVFPGNRLVVFLSSEYSITQKWVLTIDSFFEYQYASKFKGNLNGPKPIEKGAAVEFSVAPEVEYNFSDRSGILFGVWSSVFGKNTSAFVSGLLAYYYRF